MYRQISNIEWRRNPLLITPCQFPLTYLESLLLCGAIPSQVTHKLTSPSSFPPHSKFPSPQGFPSSIVHPTKTTSRSRLCIVRNSYHKNISLIYTYIWKINRDFSFSWLIPFGTGYYVLGVNMITYFSDLFGQRNIVSRKFRETLRLVFHESSLKDFTKSSKISILKKFCKIKISWNISWILNWPLLSQKYFFVIHIWKNIWDFTFSRFYSLWSAL